MQENEILILVDGKDRTKEIKSYKHLDKKIGIVYNNNNTMYKYHYSNIKIYNKPEKIDIQKYKLYNNKKPIYKINEAIIFEDYIKIFFKNQKSKIFLKSEIEIVDATTQIKNLNILEYFKDIAQFLKDNDTDSKDNRTFLEKQYDELDHISNDSVLYYYLNKKPLEESSINVHNLIFPFKFNKSQKEAIKTVLEKNIWIIEGPPGTGKTQTILNILANLAIMQNKTVAVVSNNNEAIKNILEKMTKPGYSFLIANLGRFEKRKNFFDNIPEIQIDSFKQEENIQSLIDENTDLNKKLDYLLERAKEKAIIEKQIADYSLEQKYFEDYLKNENVDEINIDTALNENKIFNICSDLQFLTEKTFFLKPLYKFIIFHKYNLKNISKNEIKYILKLQKEFYNLKIKHLKENYENIDKELKKANFQDIQNRQNKISEKIFQHELYERYKNRNSNFTFENYLEQFNSFIKTFPIILSTTYSLRKSIPEGFLFDYIIIDESSQVDLVTGSLALSVAKNAIIVGDEKQLPQIVDLKIKENLFNSQVDEQYDYFTNSILSSIRKIYEDSVPKKTLVEHYRCHPKIIEFSNKRYYNGSLIAYPNEDHQKVDKPLILYYTAPGNHMRKVTNGIKNGTYNKRELDVIKDEVLKNTLVNHYKDNEIGITTPYRLQANLMAEQTENIESDTIHKYQGREKRLMIFSTVLDNSLQGKKSLNFVDDSHMINVAVSRAIEQFVLVTDNKMFKENGEEINALLKYIQYQSMSSEILESELVSVFDLLYKEYSHTLNSLNKKILNRSKYKSENIIDTILDIEFKNEKYRDFSYAKQVFLKHVFKNTSIFNKREYKFINSSASFDFVIYQKMNNMPVLFIEVDGFWFHENNIIQLRRDIIKDSICQKVNIPLIRLKTNYTHSQEKIIEMVSNVLFKN